MDSALFAHVKNLLSLPTAPFREGTVRAYIRKHCQQLGLPVEEDAMGNLLVSVRGGKSMPTLALVAHMDHPGFIVEQDSAARQARAIFYGGVEEQYFPNAKVRIWNGERQIRATIVKTTFDPPAAPRVFLEAEGPVKGGNLGMWDLPEISIRRGRIHARACDDLAGCAALLHLLSCAAGKSMDCNLLAVFTVAEEAGLHGAKFLCLQGSIPKSAFIFSLEASSAVRGRARMGGGAILRVGDSRSIFDPHLTDYMVAVARTLAQNNGAFRFQRKLMDGGRCEASLFQQYGYRVTGICIPLGNYHNRNFRQGTIAPEYVDCGDLQNMADLLWGIADQASNLRRALKPGQPKLREEIRPLCERLLHEEGYG